MEKNISRFIATFLSVPTVILTCVACAFLSVFIYIQTIETFKTNVTNLSYYIESTFNDQIASITESVDSPVIKEYIINPTDENRIQVENILLNPFNIEDSVYEVSLYNLNGEVLLSSNNAVVNPIQPDTLIFQKVRETKVPYTTLEFEGEVPLIKIVYPILNNNELLGIYVRYTPLNYINYIAHNLNADNDSIYLFTSQDTGVVFSASDEENSVNIINQSEILSDEVKELKGILHSDSHEQSGPISFQANSRNIIGYYQKIDSLDWVCMIAQPRALILYDLNLFYFWTILISIIVILILNQQAKNYFDKILTVLTQMKDDITGFLSGHKNVRCETVDVPDFIKSLSESINHLFEDNNRLEATNKEVKQELDKLLTIDSITNLLNNRAIYQIIDENFGKSENQALIMFNTGIYDQLNETFGNSLTNRLLEIVSNSIREISDEEFYAARLAHDTFCIFVNSFSNFNALYEKFNELRVKLKTITRIDDLEVELFPNITIVVRDERLLGRSDWLRLATEILEDTQTEQGSFTVFDFTSLTEYMQDNPDLIENLIIKDNRTIEGFSKSKFEEN